MGQDEILEAFRQSQGYDPAATPNGPRLQAEALLWLARAWQARDPQGPPLLFDHEAWFQAFLARTGLTEDKAPAYVRLGREFKQDMEVDYRHDRVVERVVEGPAPDLALRVRIWWPATRGAPKEYSYEDTLSVPQVKVTNKRVITYHLLDVDGMAVFDEIGGLFGRPTTGVLGLLFRLVGEGHLAESRFFVSRDGLQINRARAEKGPFHVHQTVTVYPNGRTEKDLPPNRPDLAEIDKRLRQPLKIVYRSMEPEPKER